VAVSETVKRYRKGNLMMHCPACIVEFKITERQGVEIDYCPECRGVWLDRGELDKIIERASANTPSRWRDERERSDRREPDDDDRYARHPRRRRSFLEDLFDFD
jgi:Zn-finger nucleic acid-binding protein